MKIKIVDDMKETYSYKGWLNSDSFMKRAFAIYGYGIIPLLVVMGVIIGGSILISLIVYLI